MRWVIFPFSPNVSIPFAIIKQYGKTKESDLNEEKGSPVKETGIIEATISGQPENSNSPYGNLVSRPNSDRYSERERETEIAPPMNRSDTRFIKDLLHGESLYQNNLPYCGIPTATNDCYNSNSYARGILRYAGVPNPPDIGQYAPGWDKPIPLGSSGAGGGF